MGNIELGHDPVFQAAARIAGFAEASVVDTDSGKVVMTRHRRSRSGWAPYEHLQPGECALNAFYGTAFWERPDVLALYTKHEEKKASSLVDVDKLIRREFRKDIHQFVQRRPEGRYDLIDALSRIKNARIVRQRA